VGGSSQKVWNIRKLQVFDAPNTFKIFDFDASKIPTEFSAAVKIQRILTQQKTFGFLHAPCLRAKSTVHRLHLKLSKEGVYDKIFAILLSEGYESWKIDLSLSFVDTKDIPAKKGV